MVASSSLALWDTGAVAQRLGVSERTVRQLANKGALPAIRIGKLWRFDPEAIAGHLSTKGTHSSPDGSSMEPSRGGVPATRPPDGDERASSTRAEQILRSLLQLGLLQKEIANRTGVSTTVVSRILSRGYGAVNRQLTARLEETLWATRRERLYQTASGLRPEVLETCNDNGTVVDDKVRSQIASAMLEALVNPQAPLPPGIQGALMALGNGAFLIQATDPRVLIHELQHVIVRLREAIPAKPETPLPRPAF